MKTLFTSTTPTNGAANAAAGLGALVPAQPVAVSAKANGRALGRGVLSRWVLRGTESGATASEGELPSGQAEGDLVARVLAARGVGDPNFLQPMLTGLHDPGLMPDIDKAAVRILDALKRREPVVIFGDYDVDGVTATAILYHMMLALEPEAEVRTYVPHRVEEGYGLATAAIEQLAAEGAKVIVSVDCGVTAVEPAARAKTLGVDLIITDHHNPPARMEDLPDAYAVVHPRRPDSRYPFGELSGAGVAYKLAWRMATTHFGAPRLPQPLRELLVELLAFAALGAVADVVPLIGENRVLTKFGMQRMKTTRFVGLRALIHAARLDNEKVSTFDVGFKLGPRLNASGRMAHAEEAVHLFTRATAAEAERIAVKLEALNVERRAEEKRIIEQAIAMAVQRKLDSPSVRGIVLADPSWHVGVVGIACSRMVEKFCKPTILMGEKDGHWHGSGRSIEGVSLHAAIEEAAVHTVRFGGHDMAAGLAVEHEKLEAFTEAFQIACASRVSDEQLIPRLTVDAISDGRDLTTQTAQRLEMIEPCGAGNPHVRVLVQGLTLYGNPRPLGKTGEHVKLVFRTAGGTGTGSGGGSMGLVTVTAWSWARRAEPLRQGSRYDVVIRPGISRWNGNESIECTLDDLREAE
jgi:single-stranded-DNA-specific exonuclease